MKQNQLAAWWRAWSSRLSQWKLPALIFLLGLALLLLPGKQDSQQEKTVQEQSSEPLQLQSALEEILSQIEGAGQVAVLLSVQTGPVTTYQQDMDQTQSSDRTELHQQTVILGQNEPLAVETTCETYRGAVVVCQGADRATVRLNIIQAVSSLTGLGSDKITVIKMKGY